MSEQRILSSIERIPETLWGTNGGDCARAGQRRRALLIALAGALGATACTPALRRSQPPAAPVMIGLVAALSDSSAASGIAIQQGMLLAMDEVNATGGVLGRPLALTARDDQGSKEHGVAALRELIEREGIVAVFGGIYSPVMLAMLDLIHQAQVPLIDPWGSATGITRNGRSPNYAFRVSVSDAYAGEFLARYLYDVLGCRRPGILAIATEWGDSNIAALEEWFGRTGRQPAGIVRIAAAETNAVPALRRLREAGADGLITVVNAPEGAAVVRGMATLGFRAPVVSHWGISGGRFVELAGVDNAEGVYTLQTFTFYGELLPRAATLLRAYHARFGTRHVADIAAPVGVAHGYDGVHLLAQAIRLAGSTAGPAVRSALEALPPYDGVVKRYAPAFTPERHDALLAEDYLMAVWRDGQLVPAPQPRLASGT